MAKLIGKNVGDVITEYYGPVIGRNYNTSGAAAPVAPAIEIKVTGTGSVQVEQSNTPMIKGNAGPNVFTNDRIADPTTWATLGGVIDVTSGIVSVAPTAHATFSSIRVIMAGLGDGKVVIQSIWN
jgi:hypothetical protein